MSAELEHLRIGFVGCGAMAQALAGGLAASGVSADRIRGADPDPGQRERFQSALGAATSADNDELVATSDLVVLAVKPKVVPAVLRALGPGVDRARPLWISIAAGTPIAALEAALAPSARVIRAMPNTPAMVRAGATVLCPNAATQPADLAAAEALFRAVGMVWSAPSEKLMDAVTGLSGSGPAYLFLMLEALCEAGEHVGLPAEAVRDLVLHTVHGAAQLALESPDSPTTLRERVSSPGGTTLAGLAKLEDGGFRELLCDAVAAATERSRELSRD